LALFSSLLAIQGGCKVRSGIGAERLSDQVVASPSAFAPAVMQIHPITRLELLAESRALLLCHLEFRDSWGDPCKAIGRAQVDLYKPLAATESTLGQQALSWEVDLGDLGRNAKLYDQATRTYRLALEDVPEWLIGETGEGGRTLARLRASFVGPDVEGKPQRLTSEFLLER
jgi:hypothetical protein